MPTGHGRLDDADYHSEDYRGLVTAEELCLAEDAISQVLEAITGPILAFAEHMARASQPVVDVANKIAPPLEKAILTMAEAGWYYSPGINTAQLIEVRDLLAAGQVARANEVLCACFESRLSEIEAEIVPKFPNREKPIRAAFRAHRAGEYFLSVPVLLAQVEGICVGITKVSLYEKAGGKTIPKTKAFVDEKDVSKFERALLSPLAEPLPISASKNQRDPDWDELNRHQVLHGESVDYGTRMNSLKAVSLLNFIADVK